MLNKTITVVTASALVMGMASIVHAAGAKDKGFYGRIDTGYSYAKAGSSKVHGGIIDGGFGYRFHKHFRADATIGYRGGYKASAKVGSVSGTRSASALIGMVSAYADLNTYNKITPYIGGGIGFSRNTLDNATGKAGTTPFKVNDGATETSFAWKLAAGAGIDLDNGWVADVAYNYVDAGSVSLKATTVRIGALRVPVPKQSADLTAHEFRIGLRRHF